ncbi:MAG: DUF1934 domain-containing protein [Ruminococcaceae bacterium]|nr:DUF1934 domain-containing protein [Oscillospiraceae bacterium]
MIKDVIIDIKGIQSLGEESDTIEFVTDGRFGLKDGSYYLSYDESHMLDSGETVKTHIYITNENSVVLQRTGSVKSKILIEKGKRNNCFYSTPHGDLTIGVFGELLKFDLNESGGKIKLKYSIDTNLQLLSKNEVNISIREAN